ncbi:MAG: DUF378 domain-containing protein [Pseudomonadota bacterium]
MANIQAGADGSVHRSNASRINAIDWIAMVLLIIGGLNWGLVGLFNYDFVAALFGPMTTVSRVVYLLVALGALYSIYLCTRKLPNRA